MRLLKQLGKGLDLDASAKEIILGTDLFGVINIY
jgi:hypothetical protein